MVLVFLFLFGVFFLVTQVLALQNRPLNMQSSYKKILFTFLLGVAVYVLSASKNNSFLIITFFPLSVLGTNFLEGLDNKWVKESVLGGLVLITLVIFFGQL